MVGSVYYIPHQLKIGTPCISQGPGLQVSVASMLLRKALKKRSKLIWSIYALMVVIAANIAAVRALQKRLQAVLTRAGIENAAVGLHLITFAI